MESKRIHTQKPSTPPERLTGFAGLAVPASLAALAALHANWARGSYWPASSEGELAEYVLSGEERDKLNGGLPSAALTWVVALSLAGAAATVRALAAGSRSRWLRRAGWGVAAVFSLRGVAYLPSDLNGGLEDAYQRLDVALYTPLCLGVAAGTAMVVRKADGSIQGGQA